MHCRSFNFAFLKNAEMYILKNPPFYQKQNTTTTNRQFVFEIETLNSIHSMSNKKGKYIILNLELVRTGPRT